LRDDDQIYIWSTLNPKRKLELHKHEKKCTDVIFSPNENILASASYDCTVNLWHPGSHVKTKTIKGHTAPILSFDFSAMAKQF
jgi:WD40 repeat protein